MPGTSPVRGTRHDQRQGLSPRECLAVQILYRDGWAIGELSMCFELAETNLYDHINGKCTHRTDLLRDPEAVTTHGQL